MTRLPAQASLALADLNDPRIGAPLDSQRYFDCVNVILSYQNPSGGWATYENTRSFAWVEVSALLPHDCLWQIDSAAVMSRSGILVLRGTDFKREHLFYRSVIM